MAKTIWVDECVIEDNTIDWAYKTKNGDTESVRYSFGDERISIEDSDLDCVFINTEDIPKLIKALQAAHKHITNS